MPLVDNAWYINFGNGTSTGYYAVTAWAAATTKVCGNIVRQLATPAVNSERRLFASPRRRVPAPPAASNQRGC